MERKSGDQSDSRDFFGTFYIIKADQFMDELYVTRTVVHALKCTIEG